MTADSETAPDRATLKTWLTSPHSRWAFHHVAEILPTAPVARGSGGSDRLPVALKSLDGFQLTVPGGATVDLARFHALTATDAMVVLSNGRVAYEYYANGNSQDQPHILMSASKSILGLTVGILQKRGDLDVNALVSAYLPKMGETVYRHATLQNLLDMRVAVTFDAAQERAYQIASNWEPIEAGDASLGFRDFFAGLKGEAAPCGAPFKYVSPNTDLLGLVVEAVTGRRLADLVSDLLWKPMGAEDDGYLTLDRHGAGRPTGGFGATARDLARLGQLVLQTGQWNGQAVVPPEWLEDTREGGDHQAWRSGDWGDLFAPLSRNLRYRNGWYVADDQPKLMFAMGVHGQNLFVDVENKLIVAKLSSQADRSDGPAIGLTHWAIPELRRLMSA